MINIYLVHRSAVDSDDKVCRVARCTQAAAHQKLRLPGDRGTLQRATHVHAFAHVLDTNSIDKVCWNSMGHYGTLPHGFVPRVNGAPPLVGNC